MTFTRREFISTATAGAVTLGIPGQAWAEASSELRVVVGGGGFGNAVVEAYVKPFEAETGVKVTPITQDVTGSQVELMVKSKSVTVDAVVRSAASGLILAQQNLLEKIDYSIYNHDNLSAIPDYCKNPFGFGSWIYSYNLVYNAKVFPADKPRPTNWAEFWDVKKYPGSRSLQTGQYGYAGPWEEALLADGVAVDALYPIDIDRVFASLLKIKPHVVKWWTNGSENEQILRDNVADIAMSYDSRPLNLIGQGAPIEISRNEAKLTWDFWVIPRGSPNAKNAQKFIEFTSRADRQAAYAKLYTQAPSNSNAYKLLPEDLARKLASYPAYQPTSFLANPKWYLEVGSDGISNYKRLIQRWNDWILR
ncbi:ABC transporter substrate-binding protein [Bradyrhizobium sp. 145]|uniref:ABC transporter substrate-binding protein n=1 Tax=Bradyrhizobium sp. 145 TaxID=2782621 RepID=UPI001FFB604A|nr:ABC transporter substrate-binding protein [Bradyrhizobium sp. 145]MCK1686166.1 ABC transporter substrate-binding protein [Bradyrhizobium sp. 145]